MKRLLILLTTGALIGAEAVDPDRAANTVILDETGVRNLGIETAEVEETDFEDTVFALGRIEAIPTNRSVVSSRISGRIIDLTVAVGDTVEKGEAVVTIESRQAGDPPPRVPLSTLSSGLVTASEARLGEPVEPDKPLIEITNLEEVYAVARVPEHVAGGLKTGAIAHIRVTALPDEKLDGELLRFGTTADRASGTIDAVFRLANPSLTLRPDMRAEFSIVLSRREGVASIPRAALQGDPLSRYVFVEDFDLKNAYVKSPVVTGAQNDRLVEIVSGLLPGDRVVTRGAYSLAFAGSGGVSLKEALDAAHGHEHNPDGSEMTPEQRAASPASGHEHEKGERHGPLTIFSLAANALLFVLLVVSMLRRPGNARENDHEAIGASAREARPELETR
jgi:multidrug efflux pump subunit AcrA (membrane-fusion protein)